MKLCEAAVMAYAVFEDEHVPPCHAEAVVKHTNGKVSYWLCRPCHKALTFFMGIAGCA